MMDFLQILFGFLGGIFGGMGMGGGTLLIPMLVIFLQMEQRLSQGINLISFLIMALISLMIHFKHNLVDIKVVFPLVFGGVIFSVLGSFLAGLVPTEILKIVFGVFLVVLGLFQFIKVFKKDKKESAENILIKQLKAKK